MLLSIIIVNYNTCDYTLAALESVFREAETDDFEVILLDNASHDNSVERITALFGEKIHMISSERNLGFAAGNNLAAGQARGEYLLLLNPDTIVLDHAIERLLSFAGEFPAAGIWGGKTVFKDGSLNPYSCWQRQTLWSLLSQAVGLSSLFRKTNLFNPEGIGGWNREGIREVDIVSGCFLLITRKLWKDLQGFDPEFFMYGEEADLCLRAGKRGAQPVVSSSAVIVHYGGVSETVPADKMVKLIRAKMLLIHRHFARGVVTVGCILFACWPLSRYIVHTLLLLAGREASREPAIMWREVWKRRKEWLHPGSPPGAPRGNAA